MTAITAINACLLLLLGGSWCASRADDLGSAMTVGAVLQAGGVLVSHEELPVLLAGHTWRSTYGNVGVIAFKPDSTFAGRVKLGEQSEYAAEVGVFGVWTVNSGRLCMQWKHRGGQGFPEFCRTWYRVGDRFFAGGRGPQSAVWAQERSD